MISFNYCENTLLQSHKYCNFDFTPNISGPMKVRHKIIGLKKGGVNKCATGGPRPKSTLQRGGRIRRGGGISMIPTVCEILSKTTFG